MSNNKVWDKIAALNNAEFCRTCLLLSSLKEADFGELTLESTYLQGDELVGADLKEAELYE